MQAPGSILCIDAEYLTKPSSLCPSGFLLHVCFVLFTMATLCYVIFLIFMFIVSWLFYLGFQ